MLRIILIIFCLTFFITQPINSSSQINCESGSALKHNQILICFAYSSRRLYSVTKNPVIIALAIIENKKFIQIENNMLLGNLKFIFPLSPNEKAITLKKADFYIERLGQDHCVYYGVPEKKRLKQWTLLSTNKISSLRIPLQKETDRFYQLNTKCVHQGDYVEGKSSPCIKPKLIAVSDINQNKRLEYWFIDPYLWDSGLSIGEEIQNSKLKIICSACPSCD